MRYVNPTDFSRHFLQKRPFLAVLSAFPSFRGGGVLEKMWKTLWNLFLTQTGNRLLFYHYVNINDKKYHMLQPQMQSLFLDRANRIT